MKYMLLKENVVQGFYSKDIHKDIPKEAIEISDELWQELLELGQTRLINNKTSNFTIEDFEVYIKPLTKEEKVEQLRNLRIPILNAFDVYKNNVFYGIEVENDEEKLIILMWYQDLLDLKESAIENIPKKIIRYVR